MQNQIGTFQAIGTETLELEEEVCSLANGLGIVAAIIAFVSLVPVAPYLAWWSASGPGWTLSLFPWGISGAGMATPSEYWWGYTAMVFIGLAGVLGLVGSVIGKPGKGVLAGAGLLGLLSIIVFVAGFVTNVTRGSELLFYNGPDGSAYLYGGFWLALIAAILLFVASARHPKAPSAAPAPAPAPAPPTA